jgi:hypothetical protein
MTAVHDEMEELKGRKGGDPEVGSADDDDTLLPEHGFETGSITSDDEDETMDGDEGYRSGRRSIKRSLWVGLCTMATLAGRRMLTGPFRKCPFLRSACCDETRADKTTLKPIVSF